MEAGNSKDINMGVQNRPHETKNIIQSSELSATGLTFHRFRRPSIMGKLFCRDRFVAIMLPKPGAKD